MNKRHFVLSSVALGLAVCGTHATSAPGVLPQTIVRHFTPDDRASGRFQYVPFDVPAGTNRLRLQYSYDAAQGRSAIDLGLFEPGSLELGSAAFRGYSGGSKSEVTIDERDATPGYRPGPLPPGQWHVMLGLYKVAPAGVDVTLAIETESSDSPSIPAENVRLISPEPQAQPEARWYTGALHTHTLHGDGAVEPIDLLRKVRDAGLDFVAITDHNNTTHQHELSRQLVGERWPLWIVGEEVTTPAGHASVWGLPPGGWVDFRVLPKDGRIGELVEAAHRQGALFSVNHPVSDCVGCAWAHDFPASIDGIEIWNDGEGAARRALALWDKFLLAGRRVAGVGSSDWHADPNPIDRANVRVYAESLREGDILDGIRHGRVIVMRAASDPTPDIAARSGGRSAAIGETLTLANRRLTVDITAPALAGGRAAVVHNGRRIDSIPIAANGIVRRTRRIDTGYIRVQLYARDGDLVAISNPIFLAAPR